MSNTDQLLGAPKFLNVSKNCIFITSWGPQNEKELQYGCFLVKKSFNSQGNRNSNVKIYFMGPLIYVLPRASKGLKTALPSRDRSHKGNFFVFIFSQMSFYILPTCTTLIDRYCETQILNSFLNKSMKKLKKSITVIIVY